VPIVWIIRSKTPVLSTSNDLQCRRHLYITQAAIALPLENPRSCDTHLISRSWFSWSTKFRYRKLITKIIYGEKEISLEWHKWYNFRIKQKKVHNFLSRGKMEQTKYSQQIAHLLLLVKWFLRLLFSFQLFETQWDGGYILHKDVIQWSYLSCQLRVYL
jgi:hypothetical protein